MLPDSTNPRVMADNIRRLQTEVENAVELPSVQTTDEGKVLTVNSSGKWAALNPASQLPAVTSEDEGSLLTVNSSGEWAKGNPIIGLKDYSETEQDTGVKWIDNKPIYRKVVTGVFQEATQYFTETLLTGVDSLIYADGMVYGSDGNGFMINHYRTAANLSSIGCNTSGNVQAYMGSGFSLGSYKIILYYTKPTATREPDEPEVKKVTKKKTTTKGEN